MLSMARVALLSQVVQWVEFVQRAQVLGQCSHKWVVTDPYCLAGQVCVQV